MSSRGFNRESDLLQVGKHIRPRMYLSGIEEFGDDSSGTQNLP